MIFSKHHFLQWLLLLSLCCSSAVEAQNAEANLRKYHSYRERLREKFIVVSPNIMEYGVNIPASDIFYDADRISWGDANNNMAHYLSMLSTELYLLKTNKKPYNTTLSELYYAMWALERLDMFSEANWRWKLATGKRPENDSLAKAFARPDDINGFMLRDDVGVQFWTRHGSHFPVKHCRANLIKNNPYEMEEMSQDVIEHVIEGLSLVNSLTGKEDISNVSCATPEITIKNYLRNKGILICADDSATTPLTVDFSRWAKDIVKRYISYMQYDGVYEFRKKVFWKKTPLKILSTHWVLVNPVTKQPVMEGSGTDTGVGLISTGLIQAAEAITGEKGLRKYKGIVGDKTYRLAFKHPAFYQWGKEDNKTRSLACHVRNDDNFYILRRLRDSYDPHKTRHFPIYEHFPLMYLAIHHLTYDQITLKPKEYDFDNALYEGLLNSAPTNGPATNCGVREWTSTSRCLWPENLGKNTDKHTEFNGLDYMMLLNLYYIAFGVKGYY